MKPKKELGILDLKKISFGLLFFALFFVLSQDTARAQVPVRDQEPAQEQVDLPQTPILGNPEDARNNVPIRDDPAAGNNETLFPNNAQSVGNVRGTNRGEIEGVSSPNNGSVQRTFVSPEDQEAQGGGYRDPNPNAPPNPNYGQCMYGVFVIDVGNCIQQAEYYILKTVAWILGWFVAVFDMVFNYTVIQMTDFINGIGAIRTVWKVLRDFANILFIFILLYLAISTILGRNEHGVKHTLSKLIIVAVLINFSMFFTKVIIDSSNILAISFYQKINPTYNSNRDGTFINGAIVNLPDRLEGNGIANTFMNIFQFQKIFMDDAKNRGVLIDPMVTSDGGPDQARAFAALDNPGTIFTMGIITMFIALCVFIGATIIFIKRLTILMILIMSSSIVFAATLLPKTEGKAKEWWETLIKEAFYAPIFVAMIWISLLVMTDDYFQNTIRTSGGSFMSLNVIINYIIAMNLLILSLVIGEKMGVAGASGAMKSYKWLKSNIGGRAVQAGLRNTVGRVGFNLLEAKGPLSHKFQNWRMRAINGDAGMFGLKNPGFISKKLAQQIAPMFDTAFHGMAHGKISSAGNSFEEEINERKENMNRYKQENKSEPGKFAKLLLDQTIKGQFSVLEKQIADAAWDEIKDPKEKANLLKYMEEMKDKETNAGEKKRKEDAIQRLLVDRPTGEESDKIKRAMDTEHLQFNTNKLSTFLHEEDDHKKKDDPERIIYDHQKTKDRIAELEAKRTRTAIEDTELATKKQKYNEKRVAMRQFVSGLTTGQKMGLRKDQIEHEDIRDLFQGNDLEQLQRNNILSKEGYKTFADEMNKNLPTLNAYADAKWGKDKISNDAFVSLEKHVREKALSMGNTKVFENEKDPSKYKADILEYYEKNLLDGYGATAKHDGLGRFFKSDALENGKDMLEKIKNYRDGKKSQTATGIQPDDAGAEFI